MNKQPGAQFEILVDGKPRSYRDTKSGAMDAVQEPTATFSLETVVCVPRRRALG